MSIDHFIRKHKTLRFSPSSYFRGEGESGVQNLARLCNALGYQDPMHFGNFEGACYGDLINFLEDNPGAVEAMVEWISENYSDEIESDHDSDDLDDEDNYDDEEDEDSSEDDD